MSFDLRYPIGETRLPNFIKYVTTVLNVDLDAPCTSQNPPNEYDYPSPKITKENYEKLKNLNVIYSVKVLDRVVRAHGHTLHDIFTLRRGKFERIPDIVFWPKCHDEVVKIVELAKDNNMVVSVL